MSTADTPVCPFDVLQQFLVNFGIFTIGTIPLVVAAHRVMPRDVILFAAAVGEIARVSGAFFKEAIVVLGL